MFDSLKLRSALFDSLKLRLTNFLGHGDVKHLVGIGGSADFEPQKLGLVQAGHKEKEFWMPHNNVNLNNLTDPFTILEPRNQAIGKFYVVQERRVTDFKAQRL